MSEIGEAFGRDAVTFEAQFTHQDDRWIFRPFNGARAILVTDDEKVRALRRQTISNIVMCLLAVPLLIGCAIVHEMGLYGSPDDQFSAPLVFGMVSILGLPLLRACYVNFAVRGEAVDPAVAAGGGTFFSGLADWAKAQRYLGLLVAFGTCVSFTCGLLMKAMPFRADVGHLIYTAGAAMMALMTVYIFALMVMKALVRN